MLIIYFVNYNNRKITFSTTYNVLNNYYSQDHNILEKNTELCKLASEAYLNCNKMNILETDYGFTEELVLYQDYLYCFICSNSYKLLFTYLPSKDLFLYNTFPNLNKCQMSKIHDIPKTKIIGNIKFTLYNGNTIMYDVLTSCDAISNYANINKSIIQDIPPEKFLFRDFLSDLIAYKVNNSLVDPNLGLTISIEESPHIFNYLHFNNLIIITNYESNSNYN